MEDSALYDRMMEGMRAFFRSLPEGSRDARCVDLPGVLASIVPATPDRSVMNSVVYESPAEVIAAIDELAGTYDDAGVRAWTVWVGEEDREVAEALRAAGHVLDASPLAMAMELTSLESPTREVEIDLSTDLGAATSGAINDRAYGIEGSGFGAAIAGWDSDPARHFYFASLDGRPVSTVMTHDHEGDCAIELVATLPEAQGKGLGGALMHRALADGLERGCETTTLQATKAGAPLYERLGYRTLGTMEMWERRR